MSVKLVAIIPKKVIAAKSIQAAVQTYLQAFAEDFQETMASYPPNTPWRSRMPRSGPRADGRRTGAYGDGWREPPHFTAGSVTITNDVEYASAVGGSRHQSPGQAHWLGERGWNSIDEVAPAIAKRHLPALSKLITTPRG